mmetsp:Transcript_8643/g.14005  ORF Transcript_8643/g.14005 Transcript_8643/m.14005 type:complete len:119 (-) Transcript_8643:729-1085(-)
MFTGVAISPRGVHNCNRRSGLEQTIVSPSKVSSFSSEANLQTLLPAVSVTSSKCIIYFDATETTSECSLAPNVETVGSSTFDPVDAYEINLVSAGSAVKSLLTRVMDVVHKPVMLFPQ